MASKQTYEEALRKYMEGQYNEAFQLFCDSQELCESKFYIGLSFEKGYGVEKDLQEAVKWFNQAALGGHPAAMFRLGLCYENGIGIAKNLPMARYWYGLGAKAGNPGAAGHLENLPPIDNNENTGDNKPGHPLESYDLTPKPIRPACSKPKTSDKPEVIEDTALKDLQPAVKQPNKSKDKAYFGTPLLQKKGNPKSKKNGTPKKDENQIYSATKSEKKINKFALVILGFLGIIVIIGVYTYFSSNDSFKIKRTENVDTSPIDTPEEMEIEVDSIDIYDSIPESNIKIDIEKERTSDPLSEKVEKKSDDVKDSYPSKPKYKSPEKGKYSSEYIGSSNALIYVPKLLDKQILVENEKRYYGYKSARLVTKSIKYSGSPKSFLATEEWSGMRPTYDSTHGNSAVQTGHYKDAIYYRKVRIIDGIAYYAIFHVPEDDQIADSFKEMTEFIFDNDHFPLNK